MPTLSTNETSLSSDEVLDIAVAIFDPGIAEADPESGIYPEVRRAEAAFMARELALVLDDQGAWGASRIVPSPQYITDFLVTWIIEQSDGETLALLIRAVDAQGRVWLENGTVGQPVGMPINRPNGSKDPF